MPKIPKPLTELEIKNLKPKEKSYKKCDGRGLYLFVEPSGRKYFALEYKSPADGKIKRMNLGDYPRFSLALARDERFKMEQKIRAGIDPKQEKLSDSRANFLTVAMRFLDLKAHRVAKSTLKRDKRLLELYILPHFAKRDITRITIVEVIEMLKKVEKNGELETLKRLYVLLNQIWKSAYFLTQNNIIASIDYSFTFKRAKKHNYPTLTAPKELKTLWESMEEYGGDLRTKYALKIALLTALRPYNVRAMKWKYINFDEKVAVFPAEDMKSKISFTLPLSRQVIELFSELRAFNFKGEYVFSSLLTPARCMSENTLNTALRRMGYSRDELVSHGFRASFSTICNENISVHGLHFDIIEKCLAHKGADKIRATYNRAHNLAEMRALMQWWADWLYGLAI
ncbi:MAG: tyrosine-type recombinase/integrase [Wolinella sp.]